MPMASLASYIDKAYAYLEKNKQVTRILKVVILIAAVVIALYIRSVPAIEIANKYGPQYALELQGNDPWIEYWVANITYHHGILSWWRLKPTDPEFGPLIKKFWYPWGRDITTTTYPGIPLVASLTYPLAAPFGLTLKDWIAIQPLIYAVITVLLVYVAVRELLDGSEVGGLAAALVYAVLPAAADRTMIGFTEKEGAALPFVFLFIYFYSKMIKVPYSNPRKKILYAILSGLAMAMVGWFWGGYQYVFVVLPVSVILYPLFAKDKVRLEFILYNVLVSLSSIVFVSIAPTNLKVIKIYPFSIKGIGVLVLLGYVLPIVYAIAAKRKILNKTYYFLILLGIGVAGIAGIALGYIAFGGRLLYAITPPPLRAFIHLPPLVESIEEHQPAFSAHGLTGVLFSWGYVGFFIAVLGALYLIYKGREDHLLVSIIFLIAFYAYMNATYFEAAAATFGVATIAAFITFLVNHMLPVKRVIKKKRRKGIVTIQSRSTASRLLSLLFLILIAASNTAAATSYIEQHKYMMPSIMSAGTGIGVNRAWYEAIEFIKSNTTENALIVSWWDYGYWITVNTGRATLADGATSNGTQIMLLAQILTSFNETEILHILRDKLHAPDETYILVFDVFIFIPYQNNTYIVRPWFPRGQLRMVGRVDIPKSIWMIRIGRRDPSKYFYLYKFGEADLLISPRFDKPKDLPLIYRMMVDGILYLNQQQLEEIKQQLISNETNATLNVNRYIFQWWTGQETSVEPVYQRYVERLGVAKEVITSYQNMEIFGDNPSEYTIARMKYIKPYKIIFEPFDISNMLYTVIFIYKVDFSGLNK